MKKFFDNIDWSKCCILCHHCQFDGLALSHYYRVRPHAWLDTLSMARLVHGIHHSNSLDALAQRYGLPAKSVPYNAFKGLHWDELSGVVQEQLAEGGQHDVLLTYELLTRMLPYVPDEELRLIDLTIRMFVEPVLRGDIDAFKAVELGEIIRKQTLREQLNVTDAELQSAERFAELLRACGIEPPMKQTPAGQAYAFARTDKFMTEVILEHPDDRVRTLGEARLRARSTIEQTRAERLAGMAGRGAMPVYLQYAGAHTTRWSGGDKLNWQNFKRGSGLRKAIHAPAGYQIVKVDKSQIECRFLNYLAGQWDVVERFRRKEDPYVGIASMAYGERVYKAKEGDPRFDEMLAKRGTGKQLELSCLGPDTLVLTHRGSTPITKVQLHDWLWDGQEWISHNGVVSRGERCVIKVAGDLYLTPDHLVLCGTSNWLEAICLHDASTLSRALATASGSLPSRVMKLPRVVGFVIWSCVVRAALTSIQLSLKIFVRGVQHAATLARKKRVAIGLNNIMVMSMFAPTIGIGDVCWGGLELSLRGRLTDIETTVDEGSACTKRGAKTDARSSLIWSHFQDGMNRFWRLIASIMKKDTNRVIFGSYRMRKTAKTDDRLERWQQKMPTYDISCAGPRNRFTVVTAAGPLIVHNCGYGAGTQTIALTAAKGTYGPPVQISLETADAWKKLYRRTHACVVDFWYQAEQTLYAMSQGLDYNWSIFKTRGTDLILPNGTALHYPGLERVLDDNGFPFWRYQSRYGWRRIWGGFLVENVIQAVSRVDIGQCWLRLADMGYRVVLFEHDALGVLVRNESAERDREVILDEMKRAPQWCPEIPLDAEATMGESYA
jgi:hypothetical protein